MKSTREDDSRLAERAAQWLGMLNEDDAGRAAFFNWLAESPRHVDEFLSTLVLAQEIAELTPEQQARIEQIAGDGHDLDAPSANVVTLGDRDLRTVSQQEPRSQRAAVAPRFFSKARPRAAVAAALVLFCAAGWFFTTAGTKTYTTAIGEQRVLELSDGSIVYLNTDSQLSVRYTRLSRALRLLNGQALFKVRHDANRPFLVHSGSAVIRAVGTQFDVYRRAADTRVAVIEGVVQILRDRHDGSFENSAANTDFGTQSSSMTSPASAALRLSAGEAAAVTADGKITKHEQSDSVRTTAWRQRRLVFREDTLGDIAAEFNRYNASMRIRVVGEAATNQHFSGTFDADSPETLVQALAGDNTLVVEYSTNEIIIRARHSP